MLNRRHKTVLFITFVATGSALLAGATHRQLQEPTMLLTQVLALRLPFLKLSFPLIIDSRGRYFG